MMYLCNDSRKCTININNKYFMLRKTIEGVGKEISSEGTLDIHT